VKLLPVLRLLGADNRFSIRVVLTGQHREMVDQILDPFGIRANDKLDIMQQGQSLNEIVCRIMPRLDALYAEGEPVLVMVQGDTTSAFCAALAAFHRGIKVAHVEAGLRSFNRFHPYPEEANRKMISAFADLHLAPTQESADNLTKEGIPRGEIYITGNTTIDSLLMTLAQRDLLEKEKVPLELHGDGRLVLITVHRRESWAPRASGEPGKDLLPLEEIFTAIRETSREYPEVDFVYPVHKNPRVGEPARRILGGSKNVHLLDPLPYIPFVGLMARATAILTDSGGIQEEAPSLGIPVLVLRETTERPEGLAAGTSRLVGTQASRIREELRSVLDTLPARPERIPCPNPFGDGRAAERICQALLHAAGLGERPEEFQPPVSSSSAFSFLKSTKRN
jgi:UDP-N-acetylglucosamine 2-epimerase (non-hydrolysing)